MLWNKMCEYTYLHKPLHKQNTGHSGISTAKSTISMMDKSPVSPALK
ncbi:hypothetical protein V6C42_11650 [Pseudoclostridium thermosuccinogenes]